MSMTAREKGYFYDAVADLVEQSKHRLDAVLDELNRYEEMANTEDSDWAQAQISYQKAKASAYMELIDKLEKM